MLCLAPVGLQLTAGNWSQFSVFVSQCFDWRQIQFRPIRAVETTTKCLSASPPGGESVAKELGRGERWEDPRDFCLAPAPNWLADFIKGDS